MDGTILEKKYKIVARIVALEEGGGGGGGYVLPIASADTLGGVKVGNGLSINAETGVLSASSQSWDYSTNEVNTGQKWVDGSDIYVKTIDIGQLPENNYVEVNHGITGIDKVVKIELSAYTDSGVSMVESGIFYANFVDSTKIRVTTTFLAASYTAKAAIFYIKTAPTRKKK